MVRALAVLICAVVGFITFSLCCCLRAASREDEWMEEHSPGSRDAPAEQEAGRRYGR